MWIAWVEGHEERRGGQAGYGYLVRKSNTKGWKKSKIFYEITEMIAERIMRR